MSQFESAPSLSPAIEQVPIFTDFSLASRWVQIGVSEITKTVTSSGMILTGNGSNIYRLFFSGIALRGTIYGDKTDGEITFKHTWDSYVRPSDLSIGQTVVWGITWTTPPGESLYSGYGGCGSSAPNDKILSGTVTANGLTGFATESIAPATTNFVITDKIAHAIGGFNDMAFYFAEALLDGARLVPVAGGNMGSSRRTMTFGPPAGLRVRLGVLADRRTALGSARLTRFEIVKGQFVPD